MNEKIDTIIKYMQSKNTTFTVGEINEISGILNSLKEVKDAGHVADKETTSETTSSK